MKPDDQQRRTKPPDQLKALCDPGTETKKSGSSRSASRDHPNEDGETMDPTRWSEDPANATDGDQRRLADGPTEPLDTPGGAWGRLGGTGRDEGIECAESVPSRIYPTSPTSHLSFAVPMVVLLFDVARLFGVFINPYSSDQWFVAHLAVVLLVSIVMLKVSQSLAVSPSAIFVLYGFNHIWNKTGGAFVSILGVPPWALALGGS